MHLKLSKKNLTIAGLEADETFFSDTLKDYSGKLWEEVTPVIDGTIAIRPEENSSSYHYASEHPKKRIVLHATHGFLSNDVANLSKHHVSTAYVISRGGVAYELFDPKFWSYHIGKTPKGAWWRNKSESQQTIAIELSNIGNLLEHPSKPDILTDAWGFPYCMKDNTDFYVERPYRGYKYYATYTDAQMKALDSLLLKLCRKFDIPHSFLHKDERMQHQTEVPTAGIVAHVNYRTDKTDVSPAFDWMKISGR